MQDTRTEYVKYSATWPEWVLTGAGLATFFLFFTLMSKFVTVVPVSGLEETNHHHNHQHEPVTVKKEEVQPV